MSKQIDNKYYQNNSQRLAKVIIKRDMSTYLVTGATGYIGSMLINRIKEMNDNVTVLVRNIEKLYEMGISDVDAIQIDLCDKVKMGQLIIDVDYIIHCASITKSSEMVNYPVEVIESIVNTTQNIMELANRCHAKSVVYLSSMEVYGNIDCSNGHRVTEDEMGYVDLLNARNCYPIGKRMAENICYSYFSEYDIPVKIARLSQTFGKGVLKTDNRVFMQFAKSVITGEDIVLHTKGESIGNYCGIDDTISGIMTILFNGKNGEAYNVVNEANTMAIKEMAELVCAKVANGTISVKCDISDDNKHGYAPNTGLMMSAKKLMRLGWKPRQTLVDMYQDVIHSLVTYTDSSRGSYNYN